MDNLGTALMLYNFNVHVPYPGILAGCYLDGTLEACSSLVHVGSLLNAVCSRDCAWWCGHVNDTDDEEAVLASTPSCLAPSTSKASRGSPAGTIKGPATPSKCLGRLHPGPGNERETTNLIRL